MGRTKTAGGSLRAAEIVVKLYETRDFVKRVNTPEDYLDLVRAWADRIRAQMAAARQTSTEAMISLLKQHGESTYSAWIQAAYVEMTEGCLADDGNQRGAAMVAGSAGIGNNGKGSKDMSESTVLDAQVAQDAAAQPPAEDGEPKIIRVYGRLEQITMPTERGKELVLKVVLANNGENRLALAMLDGTAVAIEATERDETPAVKVKAPEECDDQPMLFNMDGDEGDSEGDEE